MISKLRPSRATNNPSRWGSGQTFVLVALGIFVLVAMSGLVFDVGMLWLTRQQMQRATDAAAKAGANEIANQNNVSGVSPAGIYDATQNGFTQGAQAPNGGTVTSVVVRTPPTGGPYAGQENYVEAIITTSVPTYFLRVLGFTTVPISTRATAKPNPAPVCIWALDTAAQHDLVIGTGASPAITVQAPNCDVYVDSANNDPIGTHGGDCLNALQIFSVGGFQDDGGCSTPTPQQDVAPVADPLADIPAPTAGGCGFGTNATTPYLITSTTCGGVAMTTPGTCNLSPGTYCDGIKTGTGSGATFVPGNTASAVTINFASGQYVMNGGGMRIGASLTANSSTSAGAGDPNQGPASSASTLSAGQTCGSFGPPGLDEPVPPSGVTSNITLSGSGVSFYNTAPSAASFAPILIYATSGSSLTAATSGAGGAAEGILFFQDRSMGACSENLIYGGTYTGTFYFENSEFGFGGTGGTYNYFIADMIQITKSMTVNVDTSSLAGGSLVKIGAALAE
jgi:hypothetical protein